MHDDERLFYKYIVISKAIGDFIAFESFLTDKEKINIKEIIYLSVNENIIQFDCIDKSSFYNKNYKKTIIRPNIRINKIDEKEKVLNAYFENNPEIEKDKVLIDWNFYNKKYKNIIKKQNIKNYSFFKEKLCEIDKFNLPSKYVSLSGWTYPWTSKRMFNIEDWQNIISALKKYNVQGIILNNQDWYLKNSWFRKILKNESCLINLVGKTNLFEAMEIVKKSTFFIGIDSSLSVIASQSLSSDAVMIKSNKGSSSRKLFNYFYSNLKTKKSLVKKISLI